MCADLGELWLSAPCGSRSTRDGACCPSLGAQAQSTRLRQPVIEEARTGGTGVTARAMVAPPAGSPVDPRVRDFVVHDAVFPQRPLTFPGVPPYTATP